MRSHRLVSERRQGRRVFYRLFQPDLALWLVQGLKFIEHDVEAAQDMRDAVEQVKALWSEENESRQTTESQTEDDKNINT